MIRPRGEGLSKHRSRPYPGCVSLRKALPERARRVRPADRPCRRLRAARRAGSSRRRRCLAGGPGSSAALPARTAAVPGSAAPSGAGAPGQPRAGPVPVGSPASGRRSRAAPLGAGAPGQPRVVLLLLGSPGCRVRQPLGSPTPGRGWGRGRERGRERTAGKAN